MRGSLVLFAFLSVVYHSNLRPVASGDSLPAALLPLSVVMDRSITLDRFGPYVSEQIWYGPFVLHHADGHWYSTYPIAGPLLATPLYLPIAVIPKLGERPPGTLVSMARILEKFAAVFWAAGAAVALLFLLRRLTTERAAWMLTLVFALGTANWSTSSQALWQHTFGQVAIIGCLYAVHRWGDSPRWYWMAGGMAAVAVAIRPTNVALLPALAVALWMLPARVTQYVRVFVPVIAGTAMLLAYNLSIFGSVSGGYSAQLKYERLWDGLLGVLISPGRGLLVYTPIVIFALAAIAAEARHRQLVAMASIFTLTHIVLVSMWPNWWGGYSWGPRLLTETIVPLVVLIAVGWPAIRGRGLRSAFAVTAMYCVFVQGVGVYCYPKGHWDSMPVSVNDDPSRLWDWADNPMVRTVQGGVAWEPYAIVGAGVRGGMPGVARKMKELGINAY
ncbi:MAG: hypothetical protein ABIR70_10185 [Bryobacteraceae bacterium]